MRVLGGLLLGRALGRDLLKETLHRVEGDLQGVGELLGLGLIEVRDAELHRVLVHVIAHTEPVRARRLEPEETDWSAAAVRGAEVDLAEASPPRIIDDARLLEALVARDAPVAEHRPVDVLGLGGGGADAADVGDGRAVGLDLLFRRGHALPRLEVVGDQLRHVARHRHAAMFVSLCQNRLVRHRDFLLDLVVRDHHSGLHEAIRGALRALDEGTAKPLELEALLAKARSLGGSGIDGGGDRAEGLVIRHLERHRGHDTRGLVRLDRRARIVLLANLGVVLHHRVAIEHRVLPVEARLAVLAHDNIPLVHPPVVVGPLEAVQHVPRHLLGRETRCAHVDRHHEQSRVHRREGGGVLGARECQHFARLVVGVAITRGESRDRGTLRLLE
mmetsp:Transcript_41987/g.97203  ORF Transcript_41987/g.97203 Transcript_41987/m.97203 type:complete len:388 (+) Transcript_41987:192-1355(+)